MRDFGYSFGIEEEFFLCLARTGALATRVPHTLVADARGLRGETVRAEMLQSQIELASPVFQHCADASAGLRRLRRSLAELVDSHDLRLIAAGTHPCGGWQGQRITDHARYARLAADFGIVGRRNLVCGLHVHVATPPDVDRIDVMNRAMRWLPLFLALSTSSPFWNGRETGLLSYRQALYDEWPRSGIPDYFDDEADYAAFTARMVDAGAMHDTTQQWWTITLVENPALGARRTTHTRRIVDENRWRAKRDGIGAWFIAEGSSEVDAVPIVLSETLALLGEQIQRLECADALWPLQRLLRIGSSAHEQLRIYNDSRAAGASPAQALRCVVAWLERTTIGEDGDAISRAETGVQGDSDAQHR